jgi:hypothetical protein
MINPKSIPNFVWAAIAAGAAAFLAPGATFVVTRIFHQMTNSCEAGSSELAAAGMPALSIIPAATLVFRDAVLVEAAERRKQARALITEQTTLT